MSKTGKRETNTVRGQRKMLREKRQTLSKTNILGGNVNFFN